MNADFRELISTVKTDIASNKIHRKEYDAEPDLDQLKALLPQSKSIDHFNLCISPMLR